MAVRFIGASRLVDLIDGVLKVRDTKFGKSRNVPLHHSTPHASKHMRPTAAVCGPTP